MGTLIIHILHHGMMLQVLMPHNKLLIQMGRMIRDDIERDNLEWIILMQVNLDRLILLIMTKLMVNPMLHLLLTPIIVGLGLHLKERTDRMDNIQDKCTTDQIFIKMDRAIYMVQ